MCIVHARALARNLAKVGIDEAKWNRKGDELVPGIEGSCKNGCIAAACAWSLDAKIAVVEKFLARWCLECGLSGGM